MSSNLKPADSMGQRKLALSRAVTTDFEVPTPGDRALLPFQRVGVEYASLCHNVLNADPPGVGKTIQEIGYMNRYGIDRALILCPASLLYNWRREIEAWHLGCPDVQFFNPKTFNPKRPPDILLMSYYWAAKPEAVKLILKAPKFPLMTLDEVQYLKNPDSRRTKYVLAKNGLKTAAERVHCLSGTPLVNRPMDMWPILGGLFPEVIGGMSKFSYGMEFCGGWKTPWGHWDFTGSSNLPILGSMLRTKCMVRRVKADVLKELPPRYPPNIVYLDQSPAAKKACQRLALFDEDAIKRSTVTYSFEEMSQAQKELGVAKVPAAVSYISEVLKSGHEKVLVFAHHREVIEALQDGLKEFGALKFVGGMTGAEKDGIVSRFQNSSEDRVLVISLTAGGVGLTLTRSSYVILVEFSWVPGENEQAIDRVHRIGQTNGVVTDYLVFEDSLDERKLKYCFQKQNVFDKVFA